MSNLVTLLSFISLLILASCTSHDTVLLTNENEDNIETIICSADSSQSYELFLPANYSSTKQWPVLLCFDPHGRGHIPIKLLKNSAEKYGYIIAASNNSKNSHPKAQYVIDIFFNDVMLHYSINKSRIYTVGFSGGGKIAGSIALQKNNIKGVICCAAGMPIQNFTELQNPLNYYGIIGNEDFNYQEMIELRNYPKINNLNIQIQIFDGEHDWPPASYLDEALLWMEFNAMRDKFISVNKKQTNDYYIKTDSALNVSISKKEYSDAYWLAKKGIQFLNGLKDVEVFETRVTEISQNRDYQKQKQTIETLYKKEFLLRNSLIKDYQTKDEDWWRSSINSMKSTQDNSHDKEKRMVVSRVLNYLSMVSYIFTNKALSFNDFKSAEKYLKIYEMLDPTNQDCHFFKAVFFERTQLADSARVSYKKAIEYGFDDFERAEKDLSPATIN